MPEQKKDQYHEISSPLSRWPGQLGLPLPDDFNGLMWRDWRKAIDETEAEEVNRLYAYAGAKIIKKHGQWAIEGVTLAQFQKWENSPADEMMRLVSWVGRSMQRYMDQIIDPKG